MKSKKIPLFIAFSLLIVICVFAVGINSQKTTTGSSSSTPKPSKEEKESATVSMSSHKDFINRYCLDCHDSDTEKGQVNLESLSYDLASEIQVAEQWQDILDVLNSGEMPPKKKKQPTGKEKAELLEELSTRMVMARKIHGDNGGIISMRRLNRREYANTVEALLGVRPEVSGLPDERSGGGFDTAGASLYFSSDQFEQYLEIARGTLEKAIFSSEIKKSVKRYEAEKYYGRASYQRLYDPIVEKAERARSFIAKKGATLEEFDFKNKYEPNSALRQEKLWKPTIDDYMARPETETGAILMAIIRRNEFVMRLHPIVAQVQETAKLRVRVAAYPGVKSRFHYIEFASRKPNEKSRQILGWRKVSASIDKPEIIEFPIEVIPGEKVRYEISQRSHPPGSQNDLGIVYRKGIISTPPGVWMDWAELEHSGRQAGDSPEVASIFFQKPNGWSESRYAREVIKRFAIKAFRTAEPKDDYLNKLMTFFDKNRTKGQNVRQALLQPLSIVLASPNFLYMVESSSNKKLSDVELAVRLSYFLWSMPPDKELIALAQSGRLSNPSELKQQTSRLMADSRADQFIESFTYQWLGMDRLGMFVFDTVIYEEHDAAVLLGSRNEIYKTMRYVIDKQLPLKTLLKADFVVVNDIMAEYYGLADHKGHEFRPLSLPSNSVRGGLLSTAAVLAMGSDGKRTSPVERGSWVLRHLLNDPPPPAPANVPQLDRFEDRFQPARQLGKAHQEEPQCTQCHRKIDPIGYGMEHFDAAGLWRDKEVVRHEKKSKEFDIDPSGELADGTGFSNFIELRNAIATREDDFARGFAESIIAYGLGRPYGFTDYDLAETVLKKAKAKNYSLDQFIHALVQTKTFQSK